MTQYFDIKTDTDLLPKEFRASPEIENLSARVERDIVLQYTRRVSPNTHPLIGLVGDPFINKGLGLVIFLLGYREDADDPETDPDLKVALKDTVADVLEWRLRKNSYTDPMLSSSSDDAGKSINYRQEAREPFPPDWDWRLKAFDVREPSWSL